MKQVSTDMKVNQFYYEAAKSFYKPFMAMSAGSAGCAKDFTTQFNTKFDTGYEIVDAYHDLKVLSEESKEMDEIFARVVKQQLPIGVLVRIYKEI